jgi:hypothetical protein
MAKPKLVRDVEQAHGMAFVEDEARTYPDISFLVPLAGAYFCRPCRMQFTSVGASWSHDDECHPERVARRSVVTA